MSSAVASELRVYAQRLENPDLPHAAADIRHAAKLMRATAAQIERHLKVIKTLRARIK